MIDIENTASTVQIVSQLPGKKYQLLDNIHKVMENI